MTTLWFFTMLHMLLNTGPRCTARAGQHIVYGGTCVQAWFVAAESHGVLRLFIG